MKINTCKFPFYSTLIFFFALCSATLKAQVEVYRTYEDYQNGVSESYELYGGSMHMGGRASLFFYKNDKKTTIKCKEMWGFKYKDVLFRNDVVNSHPTRVVIEGKVVYYENGFAHLEMLKYNKKEGKYELGRFCYLSKDLNSEIIPIPAHDKDYLKAMKPFKAQYPEFQSMYECIEKEYSIDNVKGCVEKLEAEKE